MGHFLKFFQNWSLRPSTPFWPTLPTESESTAEDSASGPLFTTITTTPPTPQSSLSPASSPKDSASAAPEQIYLSSVTLTFSDGSRNLLQELDGTLLELQLPGSSLILKAWHLGEGKVFAVLQNGSSLPVKVKRASSIPPSMSAATTEWPGTSASTVPRNQLVSSRSYWLHLLYLVIMFSILVAGAGVPWLLRGN